MATPAFLRMSFSQCPIVADVTGKGESASNHSDNHSQPWFPVLMEMITDTPLLLPAIMDLLLDPQGKSPSNDGSGTSPVGRLECIRSTFQGRGLSEDVVTIHPLNGQDGANKFILACWMRPCMKPPGQSEKEDSLV